jgi:hypothetical protein
MTESQEGAIKMVFGIPFQTRSPDRDRATTRSRLTSVEAALTTAITAAERERDGLKKRIDLHYNTASFILDSSGDYGAREAEDEDAILRAEMHAKAGRQRLDQVEEEIRALQGLLDQLHLALSSKAFTDKRL